MALREYQRSSNADCHCPVSAGLEDRYQAAKAQLLAAQQEKLEAAVEFLAARAAMRRCLETVWPGEGGSPGRGLAAGV